MRKNNSFGFTLIELLVVITIIGILATGGVSVYTKQMAKARDTSRVKDVKAIQGAMESSYGDKQTYSTTTLAADLKTYLPVLPKDPKSGTTVTNSGGQSALDYLVTVGNDDQGVGNNGYEISSAFENVSDSKLNTDNQTGSYDNKRWEVGNTLSLNSSYNDKVIVNSGEETTANSGIYVIK